MDTQSLIVGLLAGSFFTALFFVLIQVLTQKNSNQKNK